jgi:hypothetical protein
MPVAPNNEVTQKEVEDSYEFKLMKKILKREYPWIVDILVPDDEEINKYALIFLLIVIDPFLLQQMTGWPFNYYMKVYLDGYMKAEGPYSYRTSYLTTIYDVSRDESNPIQDDIENTMRAIAKSPAIPQDLKLNKDRTFVVGEYVLMDTKVPEDVVYSQRT